MKDYSMSLEERKDFVLGYDITDDGMIKIKFAKGNPWFIPYNEKNEQIVLDKMKKQLEKFDDIECKLENKMNKYFQGFLGFIVVGMFVASLALNGVFVREIMITASVSGCISMIPLIASLKINSKLNDLRKNKKFLEIEEELNKVVRTNKNTLVDVSNKTKNAIKDFPENRPVFNINSFNYVPFKDLEQIMDNVRRNESFGFDYTERPINTKSKPKTKKKTK